MCLRGEEPIRNKESVGWLLARLDERIEAIEAMDEFEKKGDVLAFFNTCREQLVERGAD